MKARVEWARLVPDAYKSLAALERYVRGSGLEASLLHLVRLRASQINHCAYCIDMHWKDARAAGETEQRLYGVTAWREEPYYTDRERAALHWTEAITSLTDGFVPDDVFDRARSHFSEEELVKLNVALVSINAWNRMCVAFRTVPGEYKPASVPLH